jgi:imidazolonepropionase
VDNIGRLFPAGGAPAFDNAAVVLDGPSIAWVGSARPGPPPHVAAAVTDLEDAGGALVTPGLVDAHTHPLYAGDRSAEIARRSAGATYDELAAAGGGIAASVAATRSAPPAELRAATEARLRRWLAAGTTTVEAKTGYALDRDGELGGVALLAGLRGRADLPDLSVTFLAAHALPADAGGADAYIDQVATWCGPAAEAGASACDVFCDQGYFTVEQARRVLQAGRAAGLAPRIHADELAHTGGARLAAELGARSADHLLHADAADAAALARAGVVATLAPGTALAMGRLPPARLLRDAGVRLALATDHNPGTCGLTDLSVVVALAVAALDLSVDEALVAATAGGAASLGLSDRGVIAPGLRADLVAWDAAHEGAFAWAFGLRALRVWRAGVPVTSP